MIFEVGQDILGYRILSALGSGGMGIVYKAEDIELQRAVALKIIQPSSADEDLMIRRFRKEARLLAHVKSPNIVGVYALRDSDAGLMIVMEYVDGDDLSAVLSRSRLSASRCVEVAIEVLTGLSHAHGAGVIHRDVKPQNIMVGRDGPAKITDFGLAKLNVADSTSTLTQGVVGTLYYMSPEQLLQEPVDHRTDLWSVGVVLYEMLAGVHPFAAPMQASVVYLIGNGEPAFDAAFRDGLPDGVEDVVRKALRKSPDERYQTAVEMLEALRALSAESDLPAARPDSRLVQGMESVGVPALKPTIPPGRTGESEAETRVGRPPLALLPRARMTIDQLRRPGMAGLAAAVALVWAVTAALGSSDIWTSSMGTTEDDEAVVTSGQTVSIRVLDNDTIARDSLASIHDVTDPPNGAAAVQASGRGIIAYTPDAGFEGLDRFEYTVVDSRGTQSTGVVRISVSAASNSPPSAFDDYALASEGQTVLLRVLDNDRDPDSDPLVVRETSGGLGVATILADSSGISYRAPSRFSGTDSFTYEVSDRRGGVASAEVEVRARESQPLVAVDDVFKTAAGLMIDFDVLQNDTGPNRLVHRVESFSGSLGTIDPGAGTSFSYTPPTGFSGFDVFTYVLADGLGASSTGSVSIEVEPNSRPTANDDVVTTQRDKPVTIDVLANDEDADGDRMDSQLRRGGVSTLGTVSQSVDGFIYTPPAGFVGQDSFEYQVCDLRVYGGRQFKVSSPCSSTALVTIEVQDRN